MFQLNDEINLSKFGELVEKSIKQLKSEKKLENFENFFLKKSSLLEVGNSV